MTTKLFTEKGSDLYEGLNGLGSSVSESTMIDELCPYCEKEVKLESKFEAHSCPSCGEEILPCSICPFPENCLNCPLMRGAK